VSQGTHVTTREGWPRRNSRRRWRSILIIALPPVGSPQGVPFIWLEGVGITQHPVRKAFLAFHGIVHPG
jgi:hypothetical protein